MALGVQLAHGLAWLTKKSNFKANFIPLKTRLKSLAQFSQCMRSWQWLLPVILAIHIFELLWGATLARWFGLLKVDLVDHSRLQLIIRSLCYLYSESWSIWKNSFSRHTPQANSWWRASSTYKGGHGIRFTFRWWKTEKCTMAIEKNVKIRRMLFRHNGSKENCHSVQLRGRRAMKFRLIGVLVHRSPVRR